jgi:predicted O-methyltransferase YrrM
VDELLNQVEVLVPKMNGWCPIEKAKWLVSWIWDHQPRIVVEIGVFAGRSLIPMALTINANNERTDRSDARVYGIDPYTLESALEGTQETENEDWWRMQNPVQFFEQAVESLHKHMLMDCCDLLLERSDIAVEKFDDDTIDMLHIDGNHSEIASTRDVTLWFPRVRAGGIVVLDDVDWQTVQLARQLLGSKSKRILAARTWEVFQK